MSIGNKFLAIIVLVFSIALQCRAVDIKEAMIVSYAGTVEIFSALEAAAPEGKSFVIFDGKKFLSRRVQSGVKVHPGDILRSGNDGKMKIIYNNGDVFILGPATAFVVPMKLEKGAKPEVSSELLYGKVRAMIDKKGPLSGFKIRTQSIVSGVRGTDLYVTFNPLDLKTQVHVLRGEVEVQKVASVDSKESAPLFVKTGQKAVLESKEKESATVQVLASTQQDLKQIETSTKTPPPEIRDLKPEEKAQVEQLLKVSKEKVLEDIKVTTPAVYQALQSQKAETIEDISQVMVQDLSKTAPKGSSKPRMSDFEKDEDIYKKYFKPVGQ